jgi:hypothetical protein
MSQAQRRRAAQKARAAADTIPLRFTVSRDTFEVLSSEWHDHSVAHYDGRTGNVDAKTGTPLFSMKSRPGFAPCRSERGTTVRAGKGATLKFQRANPAAGEREALTRDAFERAMREHHYVATIVCAMRAALDEGIGTDAWKHARSVLREVYPEIPADENANGLPLPSMTVVEELRAGNHIATIGSGEILANGKGD